ncbi:hypothetical protein CBS101457_006959 [Exobasidium rhododendri]|nr:hypothetical protein CBS101457_006959 [Exobasidium rhododendri]
MKIVISASNDAWAEEFKRVKRDLETILVAVPACTIEHVGSTSIPGLPAKPVLDIDIIAAPEDVAAARRALVAAGYFDCGEVNIPGCIQF